MEFHWSQTVPWLLAASGLIYGILKDLGKDDKDREARIRKLEVEQLTSTLEQKHQLDLMKEQITAAQAAVKEVRHLLTEALKHGT